MNGAMHQAFFAPLNQLRQELARVLPTLLIVLAILIVGGFLAWLLRVIVARVFVLLKFDRLVGSSSFESAVLRTGVFRSPSDFVARVVQSAVWFLIVLLALGAIGTPITEGLLARFFNYIPEMVTAALVLLLGSVVSKFLARSALLAAVNAQWQGARLLAGAVRVLVMSLAVVVALEQLRIGRTALLVTFGILFGGIVLAGAIAFGFAARDLMREWLRAKVHPPQPDGEETFRHF